MNEVEFVRNNYPALSKYDSGYIEKFLSAYRKRVIRVYKFGELVGIAFYFRLTDETLDKVINKEIDLKDPKIANICLKDNGDNIHFFSVIADSYKTIIEGLRLTMKKDIKTISWYSPDMKRFFIRRILCHRSS